MLTSSRAIIICAVLLTGCSGGTHRYNFAGNSDYQARDSAEKEYVLQKAKNYGGLIELYKKRLQDKENSDTRFKLAEYYYQVHDYKSSQHYLAPLLTDKPNEQVYLLQAKNLSATRQYRSAINYINMAINRNPKSGEVYNIKGIIMAENGQFAQATSAFETARNLFVSDEIINNNLAMVEIYSQHYDAAVRYLLPLYLRGYKETGVTHNLVFALLKSGDYRFAKELVVMENLAPYPDMLLEALADVTIQPLNSQRVADKVVALNNAQTTGASFTSAPAPTSINRVPKSTPAK